MQTSPAENSSSPRVFFCEFLLKFYRKLLNEINIDIKIEFPPRDSSLFFPELPLANHRRVPLTILAEVLFTIPLKISLRALPEVPSGGMRVPSTRKNKKNPFQRFPCIYYKNTFVRRRTLTNSGMYPCSILYESLEILMKKFLEILHEKTLNQGALEESLKDSEMEFPGIFRKNSTCIFFYESQIKVSSGAIGKI